MQRSAQQPSEDSIVNVVGDGSGAVHPAQFDSHNWRGTLQRTKARIKDDRVTMAAGSLAYHWFLALFPAVIAALGVLTLVHVGTATLHRLTHGISKALPSGTAGVFNAAVRAATKKAAASTVAVIVGIAVALWSASSGIAVLQQALDIAYEVQSDRKFLARRIHSFPIMVLIAVVGGCAAALIVFGQPIGAAIRGAIPISGAAFTVVWTVVRWAVTLMLLTALFSAVYHFAPNRKSPSWRWVSIGGMVATAVFLVASLGFSYYVSAFGSYSKTYGAFAGVAILIFWLWLVGLAVLVGGEINAEVEREAAAKATGRNEPATVASPSGRR